MDRGKLGGRHYAAALCSNSRKVKQENLYEFNGYRWQYKPRCSPRHMQRKQDLISCGVYGIGVKLLQVLICENVIII